MSLCAFTMGEEYTHISSGGASYGDETIQLMDDDDNNIFLSEPDSLCTLILDPSNMTYMPVVTKQEENGEEVVVCDIDDDIQVEIAEGNDDVYAGVYTQQAVQRKPSTKPRHGCFVCNVCNKTFSQMVNLVTHERTHTGEKPYPCTVCGKKFSQQPNLWKHMRIHTGERPYACMICKKRFTQQANLAKHVRIHTGERPYACHYCGKRFTQQANLTKHVRLHTGERPYSCEYCGKTFVQQSNLERHVRTHTGDRPFQCNHCCETFRQNVHLTKHLRTVHNNNMNTIMIDNQSYTKGTMVSVGSDEDENSPQNLLFSQVKEIQPKMCIPVVFCTRTGRIVRRVY